MSQVGQFQFTEVLETLTGNTGDIVHPQVGNINIIGSGAVAINGNNTTGTLTVSISGSVASTYTTDSGNAIPAAGTLNVLGGDNINTFGAGSTVTIHLDESIVLPVTSSDGLKGLYSLGSNRFMHARGTLNTFLGQSAGALSLTTATAVNNVGIGSSVMTSVATSDHTTAVGAGSATLLTGGSNNTLLGAGSGSALVNGSNNVLISKDAGSAYTSNESNNICIGNIGVAAESNKIHIGTLASHDKIYVAATYGVTPGGTINVALVDSNGQLGSTATLSVGLGGTGASSLTDHAVLLGSGTSAITAMSVGTTGQILTGVTGNDPVWTTATYPSTVALGDVLVASATNVVGVINNVTNAGYVLTANVGAAPTFQAIPASGIGTLAGDSGTATGSTVTIAGGSNITTSASSATVTVDLDNSITLSGDVTALNLKTSTVATNLTINGNTITSGGSGTDVDINLVAKGVGGLTFDGIATGWSDSQWHIRQSEVQTSDASNTALVTIPLVEGEMITINATINGFQSDFTDACGATVSMTCYRPAAGNVTQIGEEIININSTSTATVFADVVVGSQSMVIYVAGVAAETWNWVSTHQYMFTKTNA